MVKKSNSKLPKWILITFSLMVIIAGIYFIKFLMDVVEWIFAQFGILNSMAIAILVIIITLVIAILLPGSPKKTIQDITRIRI